jgi:sensitive to high expression protein 9, mitochondrial
MLRPATSRLSLATLPRVHVRFFATTLPLKQDRGSRPPQSDPASNKAGGGIEHAQSIIRRWSEQNSIAFRQRTDSLIARLATSFARLGGEINKVTGYDEIDALKRQVVSQGTSGSTLSTQRIWRFRYIEARISASRKAARDAKVSYEEAVEKRSDSQREVNSLLERKSTWSDTDVSRFTVLVRQDHALEQKESQAKAAVAQTENEVEREFSALMRTILARYHEEQIWSDKIRSVSTYGQLAVLAVNVVVFVVAIMLVEPWKRRRLTQAFERKVQEMEMANLDVVNKGMGALQSRLEKQEEIILAQLAGISSSTASPPPARVLQEQQKRAAAVEFAGIALAREDVTLIAASVSAGILAWALRGWVGL